MQYFTFGWKRCLKGQFTKQLKTCHNFFASSSEPVRVSFFLWTQDEIFCRLCVTKQLTVPIDFHIIFFHAMEVNGYRQLFGYQHSSNDFLLCSTEEWNKLRLSKWWQKYHLWVNYHCNCHSNVYECLRIQGEIWPGYVLVRFTHLADFGPLLYILI